MTTHSAPSLVEDLRFRGLWHQEVGTGLAGALSSSKLTAYIGFDPTSDSLHLGNLMQMCTLRRLQQHGHRPIALAGGGTGMVGDPGGKSEERVLLSEEQLAANLACIRPQLERFVELGDADGAGGGGLLLENSQWLKALGLLEFLRDTGKHFTVNDMVNKESVRSRLERPEQGISYTEFSYMLLQAYDFLYLYEHHDCRLQLGGSDQFGNISMGVELVRKRHGAQVHGLTTPLVLKADGSKFGKTEAGTVWLDASRTSPFALYQFFLRAEDAVVGAYLRYFTFLDHDEIRDLDAAVSSHPEQRQAQRALARSVCTLVHGPEETARVEQAARSLYSEDITTLDEATLLEVCSEAPTSDRPRAELDTGLPIVEALAATGLVRSKSEARRAVEQGGVYVNNRREPDPERALGRHDLLHGRYLVLRRGRRDYHLVRFV
ncbi:MAG TPA: tyrosine--tRNA ligase [Acidimicrobiaceae bacterium]|nr:tyrosine--tRNA ligase [Acidimicrobiaceae bacterium]